MEWKITYRQTYADTLTKSSVIVMPGKNAREASNSLQKMARSQGLTITIEKVEKSN